MSGGRRVDRQHEFRHRCRSADGAARHVGRVGGGTVRATAAAADGGNDDGDVVSKLSTGVRRPVFVQGTDLFAAAVGLRPVAYRDARRVRGADGVAGAVDQGLWPEFGAVGGESAVSAAGDHRRGGTDPIGNLRSERADRRDPVTVAVAAAAATADVLHEASIDLEGSERRRVGSGLARFAAVAAEILSETLATSAESVLAGTLSASGRVDGENVFFPACKRGGDESRSPMGNRTDSGESADL